MRYSLFPVFLIWYGLFTGLLIAGINGFHIAHMLSVISGIDYCQYHPFPALLIQQYVFLALLYQHYHFRYSLYDMGHSQCCS